MKSFRKLGGSLLLAIAALAGSCRESTPPELASPAKVVRISGDDQMVLNGPAVAPEPLVVQVLDPLDRPVPGVSITWTPREPDSEMTPSSSVTDAQGRAEVSWTIGSTPGLQTVTASAVGVNGASAVFRGTNRVLGISGGVTVATAPPLSLSASRQPGAGPLRAEPPVTGSPTEIRSMRKPLPAAGESTTRLIVRFRPAAVGTGAAIVTNPSALTRAQQGMERAVGALRARGLVERAESSPAILTTRLTLPSGASPAAAIASIRADPGVQSVEVDELVPMRIDYSATPYAAPTKSAPRGAARTASASYPNDPLLLPQLWHYNMVDAARAWRTVTGSAGVIVAVIDDGIRFDHPAVAANLTADGYNFVMGGNRLSQAEPLCAGGTTLIPEAGYGPDPTAPNDLWWTGACWSSSSVGNHGLHVAGTIGAAGDDGIGTTGLNWQVRIRPIRVLDVTGGGSWFDVAQGVLYAAGLPASDGGAGTVTAPSVARVINMSLGGSGGSQVLLDAIRAATSAGSLVVASAGNQSSNETQFPAGYREVLAVAALGPDLQIASYTNVGAAVSLSAPGGDFRSSGTSGVASTTWNFLEGTPSYAYYQGTSMAAPHVTGVAALVLAAHPGLTGSQLRARLERTARPLGAPGRDERFGYGVVSAYRAIHDISVSQHPKFVRVHDAATGNPVRTVPVASDGAYVVSRLPEGSYYVFAGEAEGLESRIGIPDFRFGWFGDARTPSPVVISANGTPFPTVAVHAGTPREAKPNGTREQATVLLVDGYVLGHLNATHPEAFFAVPIPAEGTYRFETRGVIGSCGYGIELDTHLTLFAPDGAILSQNDDTPLPGSAYCSRIVAQLGPGTHLIRVGGPTASATGQFILSVSR